MFCFLVFLLLLFGFGFFFCFLVFGGVFCQKIRVVWKKIICFSAYGNLEISEGLRQLPFQC